MKTRGVKKLDKDHRANKRKREKSPSFQMYVQRKGVPTEKLRA